MKNKILNIFLIFVIAFIIFIVLFPQINSKKNIEPDNTSSPFKITKQVFYSGITPKNTSYSNSENWTLEVSQYTDIAIYISRNSDELNDSNTINSLYIDKIKFNNSPKIGTPKLYYQNPLKFATDTICSDYLIDNHLTYNILNFENEDNYNYYSTPNFFTDCSIPITLKYVNSNIIKDFKLSNNETLFFNGSILKNSNVNITDLESTISFCINIVTNNNKFYTQTINIDIPLSNSTYNLLDQNIYMEKETDLNFDYYDKTE